MPSYLDKLGEHAADVRTSRLQAEAEVAARNADIWAAVEWLTITAGIKALADIGLEVEPGWEDRVEPAAFSHAGRCSHNHNLGGCTAVPGCPDRKSGARYVVALPDVDKQRRHPTLEVDCGAVVRHVVHGNHVFWEPVHDPVVCCNGDTSVVDNAEALYLALSEGLVSEEVEDE